MLKTKQKIRGKYSKKALKFIESKSKETSLAKSNDKQGPKWDELHGYEQKIMKFLEKERYFQGAFSSIKRLLVA